MAAIAKKGWEQYMLQLQLHPLRTKAITAGVLAGVSDSVAQKLSGIQRNQLNRFLLKIAQKVLLEQVTSSSWNNLLFLLYYGLVVEKRPWPLVKDKIKKDYPKLQSSSWKFWPVIGWINH